MRHPKEVVLTALLVLLEVLAGFAIVVGLGLQAATRAGPGFFWLLLLAGMAGAGIEMGLATAGIRGTPEKAGLVGAGTAVAVLPAILVGKGLGAIVVVAIALGIFYWRGTTTSREPPDYEDVQRRFAFGLGVLLAGIVLVVARGIRTDSTWTLLTIAGISYVLMGLAALSTARLEAKRQRGTAPSVFAAAGAELGVVFVLSLLALVLFSRNVGGAIANLLGPAWDAVTLGAAHLAAILAFPFFWLFQTIHPHMARLKMHSLHPPASHHPTIQQHGHHAASSTTFTVVAIIAAIAVIAALIVLVVGVLPHREREEKDEGFKEERRGLLSPAGVWRAILAWLLSLFARSAEAAASTVQRARRRIIGPVYPADPIRRVYAQMLHRSATHGLPRPLAMTPAEFQYRLQARWPEGGPDFVAITDAYILRRYADADPSESDVRQIREHWARVRGIIRRQETQTA